MPGSSKQLAKVGLPPTVARRYPHELSGGMKQRTVMAISTVLNPKVIVADEPTSALDVVVQRQVMQTLGRLQGEIGSAVVLIGHDMGLIAQFADLIGVMYAGRLVEVGPVDDILLEPATPVHPAADRQPAQADRQGQAHRHPRASAGSAQPAARLRLPPALSVRVRPLPGRGSRSTSRSRRAAGSCATSIPSTRSCRRCRPSSSSTRMRRWRRAPRRWRARSTRDVPPRRRPSPTSCARRARRPPRELRSRVSPTSAQSDLDEMHHRRDH